MDRHPADPRVRTELTEMKKMLTTIEEWKDEVYDLQAQIVRELE